ncbi:unnamed protein product [Adineta ricciae]|uniref:U-box domain-containing protein n=1 Tax=Adineta ricciae TaxID=249248 RepID=A0A815T2D2_ADIRI|nr:unnamed protein product [Adineta ricciae]
MACSVTLERLQCPITRDIMEDPVIAEDGYTYDPLTRTPLRVSELRPNRAVKELIDAYREQSQNHQTATSEGSHSIPRSVVNSDEIYHRPSHPYTSAYNHRFISNQYNVNIRNDSIDYSPDTSCTGNRHQHNYEPRQHRTNGYVYTLPNHRLQTVSNNSSTISNQAVTPLVSPSRNSGTSSLCDMISSHHYCVFMLCCTILIIVCVVVIVPVVLTLQSKLPTTILTTTTTTTVTTEADGYKSKSCESIYRSGFRSVNWSLLLLHIGIARLSRYF